MLVDLRHCRVIPSQGVPVFEAVLENAARGSKALRKLRDAARHCKRLKGIAKTARSDLDLTGSEPHFERPLQNFSLT